MLWDLLKEDASIDDLVNKLLSEYEIDEETNAEDIPAMSVVVDDTTSKQPTKTQKVKTFLLLVSIILFVCFFAILTFGIVRAIYKKKLKKKPADNIEDEESKSS